jgi:hypothetical protein
MLLVALAQFQKPVNWVQTVFNNLHFKPQNLSITLNQKKSLGKETKFGVAQVIDIIF